MHPTMALAHSAQRRCLKCSTLSIATCQPNATSQLRAASSMLVRMT